MSSGGQSVTLFPIPGVGKLHRGMDQGPNATGGHQPRVLDDVFQWVTDEEGHRCGAGLHITPQGMHEIHGSCNRTNQIIRT